jgi:predicted metal-dependent HD superfamily phosphohydrolase
MSELIKKIAVEHGVSHSVDMLIALYNEPHRKYHNLDHIIELIHMARNIRYHDDDPIMAAILYHDIIYYPCCAYNEALSADVYWSHKTGFECTTQAQIEEAIRASKDHTNPNNVSLPSWAKDFLDYDLRGLARDRETYRGSGVKIWHEYWSFYSVTEFATGRIKFLKHMLDSPKIYWNHPEWEGPARVNMSTELEELERGVLNFATWERWD